MKTPGIKLPEQQPSQNTEKEKKNLDKLSGNVNVWSTLNLV